MSLTQEFKKFVLRGNLMDMAIGFTVGAAFTTVAKSLVNDLIMPPIGLLLGGADFSDLFVVIADGEKVAPPYLTLKAAQEAGAVTLNFGTFINNVISLLLVAVAMFILIRVINRVDDALEQELDDPPKEPEEPSEKKCPYCRTTIAFRAIRCPACTSALAESA